MARCWVLRMVYEAVTFQASRDQLRCKEIWVAGAGGDAPWTRTCPRTSDLGRAEYYASLRKPLDPAESSGALREEMASAAMLNDALPGLDRAGIADRPAGAIRLTPLKLRRSRAARAGSRTRSCGGGPRSR